MNIFETFTQAVPKAGPKAKEQIGNAQQRIDLLRARGFNAEADVFEQGLISKIQNKSFETMDNDFEEIAKFYGSNIKGAGATRPQKDDAAKAAMINAALAGFNARVDEASQRGVSVPPQLVSSIQSLIGTGKIEEANNIQEQVLGPVETPLQRDARIRETREIEAAEKEQKQKEKKSVEETQIVYSALKRDQNELSQLQKEDISDVVGFTEPPARFFRRLMAEGGAEWAKQNELLRKKLINQTTGDIFEQARKIAPVTQTDLNWLRTVVVPAETDDSSIWSDFLSKKKQVVDEKIAQIESDPEIASKLEITGIDGKNTPAAESKSASDRLRAKRQQNGN